MDVSEHMPLIFTPLHQGVVLSVKPDEPDCRRFAERAVADVHHNLCVALANHSHADARQRIGSRVSNELSDRVALRTDPFGRAIDYHLWRIDITQGEPLSVAALTLCR